MEGTCPRCGGATGESRWCAECGKELTGKPSLPTPGAAEAARREAAWLDAHPDVARAEWKSGEMQARERAQLAFEQQGAQGAPIPGYVHAVARAAPPEDPSGRARVAWWLLIAQAVVAVPTMILEYLYLGVLDDVNPETWFTSARVSDFSTYLAIAYFIQFALLIATAVAFISWLHRVYKNTRGLGAYDVRFAEGWAVGGWFVPILWYWRPKQIINDVWRASDPGLGVYAHQREWDGKPVPALFLLWWLAYNAWNFVSNIAGRAAWNAESLDADRTATIVSMVSGPVLIAAALLGARVVRMTTGRQNERAAARERMEPPQPEPQPGPAAQV